MQALPVFIQTNGIYKSVLPVSRTLNNEWMVRR